MRSRYIFLLLPLLLTACGLSPQEKADYASVRTSGVSPAVYDKMLHGDALSVSDLKALARARVNDGVVLRYLRDQGTVYFLDSNDVEGLRQAGVSQSIVDYMLRTPRLYPAYPPIALGFDYGYGPFWGPPFNYPYPYYYRGGYHHFHHP